MQRGLARRGTCLGLLGALLVAFLGVGATASVAAAVTSPGVVVPVAGAPLDGLAISASNVAYSSNPSHDEVEVLDLATNTLESPISIGTQPGGLDLSPDGSTLYVTEPLASQVAVIDVASRIEVRAITIPAAVVGVPYPAPVSVAVADTGTLLVSAGGGDGGGALLEVDPVSGATKILNRPLLGLELTASGDRSRIGVLQGNLSTNEVWIYTAATDSLSAGTYIGPWVPDEAINNDGTELVAGTWVLNDSMTIVGTLPAAQGDGMVFSPSGSTLYAVSASVVSVIDPARQLETATLALPEPSVPYRASMAVSPDGSTLVVTSQSGFSIVPLSAARPVPTCTPTVTGTGPLVVHACGGPLGGVVADHAGHIFASDPILNEIEVLDVATGTLEAPIAVGSQPASLALSADGSTLYVADDGGDQISVVNVAQRVETGRITAVVNAFMVPVVSSIALADNGEALVSTTYWGYGTVSPLFEVNLQTGVTRQVSDPNEQGVGDPGAVLAASGDGSEIAVSQWRGEISLYHAATDSFSPIRGFPNGGDLAMNGSGGALLVDPSSDIPNPATLVLDGNLNQQGAVPGTGTGLTISPDGTTAYRTDDDRVDVIDMATHYVTGVVALPESVGTGMGLLTLSGDGNHLGVLTASGLSLIATTPSPQARPTLTSMPSPASGVDGTGVSDAVVLAGSAHATGTITYSLWGPESTPTIPCAGYPRFVATQTVNGDGTYSSGVYSTSGSGYYSWVAEYTGDVANAVAGPTPCGGTGSTISIGIPHMTLTVAQNVRSGTFPLTVTYTYKVANDGDDPLQGVSVTDNACGPVGFTTGTGGPGGQLQPGSSWIFSCSHVFTQPGTFTGAASAAATDYYNGYSGEAVAAVGADTVQVTCGRTISGVVNHAVTAGPAATCLVGAQVHGNVTVPAGVALYVSGSIIHGSVGAAEPANLVMCGSLVTNEVVVEFGLGTVDLGHPGIAGNPIAPPCPGNHIESSVIALFELDGLNLTGNTIDQSVIVWDTSGGLGTQLGNNHVGGALWCAGNTPPPNDGALPNTVRGARYGQCLSTSF